MQIIISGCDRCGKSSLSRLLSKKLTLKYSHFSSPPSQEAGKKEYMNFIDSMDKDKIYLCDRFYEGEYVYAPIYRGYQLNYMREIEQAIINKTNVLYVYVRADLPTIRSRIARCGEDYVNDNDLQTVINNYESFVNECRLPYIIVENGANSDLQKNVDDIYDFIHKAQTIQSNYIVRNISYGNMRPSAFADKTIVDTIGKDEYTKYWFTDAEHAEFESNIMGVQIPYKK